MLLWLKRLLGIVPVEVKKEPLVLADPVVEETPAPAKLKAKKAAPKKKEAAIDLESMTKNKVLAHAKTVGAKANASMKKADIIAAIKNVG